tara:strand:+ start:9405 stop:9593 length:189 start_codon:yes stop_codon:yes gene_type:complete
MLDGVIDPAAHFWARVAGQSAAYLSLAIMPFSAITAFSSVRASGVVDASRRRPGRRRWSTTG